MNPHIVQVIDESGLLIIVGTVAAGSLAALATSLTGLLAAWLEGTGRSLATLGSNLALRLVSKLLIGARWMV